MITGIFFTKGDHTFLSWSYNTKNEERILRCLLRETNTFIKNRRFITRIRTIQTTTHQVSIDRWSSTTN